jgi:hypothetical protein
MISFFASGGLHHAVQSTSAKEASRRIKGNEAGDSKATIIHRDVKENVTANRQRCSHNRALNQGRACPPRQHLTPSSFGEQQDAREMHLTLHLHAIHAQLSVGTSEK